MINFTYNIDCEIDTGDSYVLWLTDVIKSEGRLVGDLEFVFCNDAELLKINQDFLNHDYFTDIITFDYVEGDVVSGDIFISLDRVRENAHNYKVFFIEELHRVMVHGILHLLGYLDKTDDDANLMREKENEKMKLFHVER